MGTELVRIALTSDTHRGARWVHLNDNGKAEKCHGDDKMLSKLSKAIAAEKPDIIAHAGDWSSSSRPDRAVRRTLEIIREDNPDTPLVVTRGNHEFWIQGRIRPVKKRDGEDPNKVNPWNNPTLYSWMRTQEKLLQHFKDYNAHHIDDGPYRDARFPGFVIVGHMGWYNHPNPQTHDHWYMPVAIEGHTHCYMQKQAFEGLDKNLAKLTEEDKTIVFMSHFPVISPKGFLTGRPLDVKFEKMNWSERIGDMLQELFGCKHFLCGHAHQYHNGPLRYESGSHYAKADYLMVEVPLAG